MFKMFARLFRRMLGMKVQSSFSAEVRLEEVIAQRRKAHLQLAESTEKIVADRTKAEMELADALKKHEEAKIEAMQAIKLREKAKAEGDDSKVAEWNMLAEAAARKVQRATTTLETIKARVTTLSSTAEDLKVKTNQNAQALEDAIEEKKHVLDKHAYAAAMEASGDILKQLDMPTEDFTDTLESLNDGADARMAKALASVEMSEDSLAGRQRQLKDAILSEQQSGALAAIEAEMVAAGELEAPKTDTPEKA